MGFFALLGGLAKKVAAKKFSDKIASVSGTPLGQAAMSGGQGLMNRATGGSGGINQKEETPPSPDALSGSLQIPKITNFYDKPQG